MKCGLNFGTMLQICALPQTNLPLTAAFNCRRILENTDHYLVEVKRTGNDDFLQHFHWLKISKDLEQVSALNLKTSDSSFQIEERFFEEGYLKFDAKSGIFIEKFNSGQHNYQLINDLDLSNGFLPIFQNYFFGNQTLKN